MLIIGGQLSIIYYILPNVWVAGLREPGFAPLAIKSLFITGKDSAWSVDDPPLVVLLILIANSAIILGVCCLVFLTAALPLC